MEEFEVGLEVDPAQVFLEARYLMNGFLNFIPFVFTLTLFFQKQVSDMFLQSLLSCQQTFSDLVEQRRQF